LTLRTKFVVVLFLFCLAACLNMAAAVYYSSFQLAKATYVFGQSPAVYRASTITDLAYDSLMDQHDRIQRAGMLNPSAQTQLEAAEMEEIRSRAHTIRQLSRRFDEPGFLFVEATNAVELGAEMSAHASLVLDHLQERSAGLGPEQVKEFPKAYEADHKALEARLSALRADLHEAPQRQINLARDATMMYFVLFGAVLAEMAALMVTFSFFMKWMLRPIQAIRGAAEQIATGNLAYRLDESEHDELGALAREVNHMAASLAAAQKQLKQKERAAAMGEMVSVVAHNIRNPVAGIRATAQTCLRDFEPRSATYRQQERIIKAVDSLEQWLKELVHVNLPVELTLEATGIDELIGDLKQIFLPASQRKNVSIDYAPSRSHLQVPVDRRHFVQAVASILDNAIQAAPTGSAVDIRTGQAGDRDGYFFIEISDSGPGVTENLRKKIFEPHFSTKAGGTGIGLSMAKKIIEAHSGRLALVACNGQTSATAGATFRIEIPLRNTGRKRNAPHG
jgi:signal transduction histidine kinase